MKQNKHEQNNPLEHIAVFWNNNSFAKGLAAAIDDKNNEYSSAAKWTLITTYEAYQQIGDFSKIDKFLLLVELDWNDHQPSDLYGIDILQQFRFEKSLITPCVVASFLTLEQIKEVRKDRDYEIIEPSKANYIRLPNKNLINPQFLQTRSLSKVQTAVNILLYFFEINIAYADYEKNHKDSLIGDINRIKYNLLDNKEEFQSLRKRIKSRIRLITLCWRQIEPPINSIKESFEKIDKEAPKIEDLYHYINDLEGHYFKIIKN